MNEDRSEVLIDLLIKQATEGLTDAEKVLLDQLETDAGGPHDTTFERTIAAIGLIDVPQNEQMPARLRARLLATSEEVFDALESRSTGPDIRRADPRDPRPSLWNWLGWAVAAAACMALVINIWLTRVQPRPEVAQATPSPAPEALTPAQQRQRLMESAGDMVRASVAGGTMPEMKNVSGDIVWSDSMQTGYMRFRGLPVNDKTRETYQLWIFDETQDEKTPIDGGTFDVNENGEVIIPIRASLRPKHPKLFAVTVEKPGGVVVSKREKVAALAKAQA